MISEKLRDGTIKRGKITFLSNSISIFFEGTETKVDFKETDSLTIATLSQQEITLQSIYKTNKSKEKFYWNKKDSQEKYLILKTVANHSTLEYNGKEIAKLSFRKLKIYQIKIQDTTISTNIIIGSFLPIIL